MSYLKAAIDGKNGAGKSGTSARLAVGISKELCDSAPVLAFDTEERWRFYKASIFDVENIPLIVVPGKSLIVLQEALYRAEKEGCCCFVGDQLTTPWLEANRAFSFDDGTLSFSRRQQLMNEWEPVVNEFRYGAFHAICCGRMGYHWQNVEDENGVMQLTQGDSKFNAGGGNNFGYEADLELEIRRRKRNILGLLRGRTSVEHVCDVIKDAALGVLNGKQFVFPSTEGAYKKGDYKDVFGAIRPYIDAISNVAPAVIDHRSTREVLQYGKTAWAQDQSNRKGLLEEIYANLDFCFPAGEGKSKLAKAFRDLTFEYLNGYISTSRMEDEATTKHLERNLAIIKAVRKRVENKEIPATQEMLHGLLELATQDVFHPGQNITLLEAMGRKTVESIEAKKRTQQQAAGD